MALSQRQQNKKPSKMFLAYVTRMAFRAALFATLVYTFITRPERLRVSEYFGFAHGFNLVDLLFIGLFLDMLTKFFPKANISMGSLKQYAHYQIPTIRVFRGGKEGFVKFIEESLASGKAAILSAKDNALQAIHEVRDGTIDTARTLMRDIGFLRSLTYQPEDLTADQLLQSQIRHDRAREVIPALLFWLILNSAVYTVLMLTGNFTQEVLVLWCGFYFLSDMICVVIWCPIQVFLMKNRCCTTCQIFNWDGIMAVTPIIPITFATPFAGILVFLAVASLIRWEVAFVRHPERFDERTNLSIRCASCSDKLCYLRPPFAR